MERFECSNVHKWYDYKQERYCKLSASSNQKLMLMVSYVGYQTITDTITANGKRYTIRLLPESTELADVVVFGKTKAQVLRESPEAVSVINAKELQGRSISLETVLNKNHRFESRTDRWLGEQFENYCSWIGRKPHSNLMGRNTNEYF